MGMINWIYANSGNIIAAAAIVTVVALALKSIWKRRGTGGCSCGCGGPSVDLSKGPGSSASGSEGSCASCRSSCAWYSTCTKSTGNKT